MVFSQALQFLSLLEEGTSVAKISLRAVRLWCKVQAVAVSGECCVANKEKRKGNISFVGLFPHPWLWGRIFYCPKVVLFS